MNFGLTKIKCLDNGVILMGIMEGSEDVSPKYFPFVFTTPSETFKRDFEYASRNISKYHSKIHFWITFC